MSLFYDMTGVPVNRTDIVDSVIRNGFKGVAVRIERRETEREYLIFLDSLLHPEKRPIFVDSIGFGGMFYDLFGLGRSDIEARVKAIDVAEDVAKYLGGRGVNVSMSFER